MPFGQRKSKDFLTENFELAPFRNTGMVEEQDFKADSSFSPRIVSFKLIANQLHPKVREFAVLDDPIEGRIDLIDELSQGNSLSEKGVKQLDHAFDLAKFSSGDEEHRKRVDGSRNQIRDMLANHDFARLMEAPEQDRQSEFFKYKGQEIPKVLGSPLFRKEQDALID